MTSVSANHLPIPEMDLKIDTVADVVALVQAAQQLPGITQTIARGFASWVAVRHSGISDDADSATKARYRRIAAQLTEPADSGPPSPKRKRSPAKPPIIVALSESAGPRLRVLEYSASSSAFGLVEAGGPGRRWACSERVEEARFTRARDVSRAA